MTLVIGRDSSHPNDITAGLTLSVDRGLLVTRFWHIRVVNQQTAPVTGLTRDGVFLIEQGKATSPVMNFRFNQSPVPWVSRAGCAAAKAKA